MFSKYVKSPMDYREKVNVNSNITIKCFLTFKIIFLEEYLLFAISIILTNLKVTVGYLKKSY